MELLHITGTHPFCPVRQAARLGGCLDAPDFVPAGATGCELSSPVWGRDEAAAHVDADHAVERLRRATAASYLIPSDAEAWQYRTRRDSALISEYVRSLGIDDVRDLIERVTWAAQHLDDQDARAGGNPGPWGSLIAESDFNVNRFPS